MRLEFRVKLYAGFIFSSCKGTVIDGIKNHIPLDFKLSR